MIVMIMTKLREKNPPAKKSERNNKKNNYKMKGKATRSSDIFYFGEIPLCSSARRDS